MLGRRYNVQVLRRGFLGCGLGAGLRLLASEPRIEDVASANNPYGLRIGPDGALYVCEIGNHRISRLDLKTGSMRTVIDGQKEPYDLRFDKSGLLYFVDMPAHQVRSLDLKSGKVTVIAGTGEPGLSGDNGPAPLAQLKQPHSLAFDSTGRLLICDIGNRRIRIVDKGVISTLAVLDGPRAIDFDKDGVMYVVLREGNAVLRLDQKSGRYDRVASGFKFSGPKGICCAPDGSIFVADTESHSIQRIDRSGDVSTVAGTGAKGNGPLGDPRKCGLSRPHGVFVDAQGTLFIGDSENNLIRKVST